MKPRYWLIILLLLVFESLRGSVARAELITESEPNDSPAAADLIPTGTEYVTDAINPAGDQGYFALEGQVADLVFVSLDTNNASSGQDSTLVLLDIDRTTVTALDEDDAPTPLSSGIASARLPGTESLFGRVQEAGDDHIVWADLKARAPHGLVSALAAGETSNVAARFAAFRPSQVGTDTAVTTFNAGWNLIALPLDPATPYTAESLGQDINAQGGSATIVQRWDGSGWQTHQIGLPFGDFPIALAEGYFVRADGPSTSTLVGYTLQPQAIPLRAGWNLIAVPVASYTAESLGQDINAQGGSATIVQRWDGSGWQTHQIGLPFGDFPIAIGQGYFVRCNSPSTWMPVSP